LPPTIEEILTERDALIPEEYFLFKNSWKFYLMISVVVPLITLLVFNPQFPMVFFPFISVGIFVYIWL